MPKDHYSPGEYNIICERCGGKKKRRKGKLEWHGRLTCGECWEARHPQDHLGNIKINDNYTLPSNQLRFEPADVFDLLALVWETTNQNWENVEHTWEEPGNITEL